MDYFFESHFASKAGFMSYVNRRGIQLRIEFSAHILQNDLRFQIANMLKLIQAKQTVQNLGDDFSMCCGYYSHITASHIIE